MSRFVKHSPKVNQRKKGGRRGRGKSEEMLQKGETKKDCRLLVNRCRVGDEVVIFEAHQHLRALPCPCRRTVAGKSIAQSALVHDQESPSGGLFG